MDLFDLSHLTAVVTGGNQGIGYEIAKGLARAGATVVIANRRAAEGERAAKLLEKDGLKVSAVAADVSERSSVESLVTQVRLDFEQIDILVNNAGVIARKPALDTSEEEWDRIFDVNLKGLFFCCQIVGREMIKRGRGKIINISSNVSEVAMAGRSIYAISRPASPISHEPSPLNGRPTVST